MSREVSQYDEPTALAEFLWHNYPDLFSESERLAEKTLHAEQKMTSPTMSSLMRRAMESRWVSRGNSEVDALLADGPHEFRLSAATRVLELYKEKVCITRCPVCRRIVATPHAQQCLWCGHDWHETPLANGQ